METQYSANTELWRIPLVNQHDFMCFIWDQFEPQHLSVRFFFFHSQLMCLDVWFKAVIYSWIVLKDVSWDIDKSSSLSVDEHLSPVSILCPDPLW